MGNFSTLLVSVLYFHNVNNMIEWGDYRKGVDAINLPYISVFDKSEAKIIGDKFNFYY